MKPSGGHLQPVISVQLGTNVVLIRSKKGSDQTELLETRPDMFLVLRSMQYRELKEVFEFRSPLAARASCDHVQSVWPYSTLSWTGGHTHEVRDTRDLHA
jgi:hypothetical protein